MSDENNSETNVLQSHAIQSSFAKGRSEEVIRHSGHLPELDGLRGVAIILVLAVHFGACCRADLLAWNGTVGRVILKLLSAGGYGVDLFFVLSGFLITGILLEGKGKLGYFRNFYARRSLRIFPLYFGVLILTLLVFPDLLGLKTTPDGARILANQKWIWFYGVNIPPGNTVGLFSDHLNFVHFWSLCVEEHFYILWPAMIWICSARRIPILIAATVLFAIGVRLAMIMNQVDGWTIGTFTFCRMDALAIGGGCAWVARSAYASRVVGWNKRALYVLCLSAVVIFVRPSHLPQTFYQSTLMALFFASLIIHALSMVRDGFWHRFLSSPPLRAFGKYSYSLYVMHYLFLGCWIKLCSPSGLSSWLGSGLLGSFSFIVVSYVFFFGVAFLTWHGYEKHFLGLKKYFV